MDNKTIILLSFAEYPPSDFQLSTRPTASSAKYQAIFRTIYKG